MYIHVFFPLCSVCRRYVNLLQGCVDRLFRSVSELHLERDIIVEQRACLALMFCAVEKFRAESMEKTSGTTPSESLIFADPTSLFDLAQANALLAHVQDTLERSLLGAKSISSRLIISAHALVQRLQSKEPGMNLHMF